MTHIFRTLSQAGFGLSLLSQALAQTLPAPLPTGASVVAGQASIAQAGRVMTITQTTPKLATNWQSFNIGAGHSVNFVQPSASAVALNRVTGADVSTIQGALNANGQVFLVNPNGVLFTPTAQVNVGSLVASTLNLSTDDFLKGNYRFAADPSTNPDFANAAIVNQGHIVVVGDGAAGGAGGTSTVGSSGAGGAVGAGTGGSIALLAAKVSQSGSLQAPSGQVLIGAGQRITLDLGGPIKLNIEQGALNALIAQGGAIEADGGLIYLSAQGLGALTRSVIQHSGTSRAQTLASGETGRIYLLGGMQQDRIEVGGTLDASAPQGGHGGFVETSAAQVKVADTARVSTLGAPGHSGTWLIDPSDFTISDDAAAQTTSGIGASTLSTNLGSSSIELQTQAAGSDSGNIHVNGPISWKSGSTLTLNAHNNIYINQNIDASQGSGGKLVLKVGQGSSDGSIGGAVADYYLATGVKVNLQVGQNFSTVLGTDRSLKPQVDYTVITRLGLATDAGSGANTLQGLAATSKLSGNYVLGADVEASDTRTWNYDATSKSYAGFVPIGKDIDITGFRGVFAGLGHTINNLYINRPLESYVGLIGATSYLAKSVIRDVGLQGGSIVGKDTVGGLVGTLFQAQVFNSFATSSVRGNVNVGGLVGTAYANAGYGAISNSYATGDVTSVSTTLADSVGGLVGNLGAPLANSFATGNVVGFGYVGGLVGAANAKVTPTIVNSYATGRVEGKFSAGGLVGKGGTKLTVVNSYASGPVIQAPFSLGSDFFGGLIGDSNKTTITNSYWNKDSSKRQVSGGGTGLSDTQFKQKASFAGFDFDNTWVLYEGQTAPLLRSFMTPLTLSVVGGRKTYDGSALWAGGSYTPSVTVDASKLLGTAVYTADSKYVGTHAVALSGVYSGQDGYLIRFVPASLTIDKAALTVAASTVSKTYDGTTDAPGTAQVGTLAGQGAGERVTTAATQRFTDKNAGTGKTLKASGLRIQDANGNDVTSNYDIAYIDNAQSAIDKAALTVAASTVSKTYDGTTDAPGTAQVGTLAGQGAGESVKTPATQRFTDKNAGTGKTLKASGLRIQDANGNDVTDNYDIAYIDNAQSAIDKAALTVVASTVSKTYDGTTDAPSTAQVSTLAGQGAGEVVKTPATQRFTDKNAGTSKTLKASGLRIQDANGNDVTDNYDIAYIDNLLSAIDKAKLTVSGITAQDKTYDGTPRATLDVSQLSKAGLLAGDQLDVAVTGTFDNKNAGINKPVALRGSFSGADAGNYDVTLQDSTTASIKPAEVVLAVAPSIKRYDGTTEADSALKVVTGNLYGSDQVRVDGFAYDTPQVGASKTVVVKGLGIDDGNAGNNYKMMVLVDHDSEIQSREDSMTSSNTQVTANQQSLLSGAQLTVACMPSNSVSSDEASNCKAAAAMVAQDVRLLKGD